MISTLLSIVFVYCFILLGYTAKKIFGEEINSKGLSIISVYFLQPFVTLWGLTSAKLHLEHLSTPLYYMIIIVIIFIPSLFLARMVFEEPKQRAILTIAGFVGNTGNIGIPLGIVLFGEESIIYTTLINLANVFVIYVIGVYIYSRGSFSVRDSLLNIVKIPIIPAALVAILLNVGEVALPRQIEEFIKMGAYSGIVIQLFLLGTFLEGVTPRALDMRLLAGVVSQKFLLIPVMTVAVLSFTDLSPLLKSIILMEMMTPLAVANINLASLYDCRPRDVTTLILITTLLFVPMLFVLGFVVERVYGV